MKRLLALGIVLLAIIYIMPLAYTRYYEGLQAAISQDSVTVNAEAADVPDKTPVEDTQADVPADVPDSGEITVYTDGEVRTMPLESYVAGVVAAEISSGFPQEALRAQAVAARTYAVYKMRTGTPAESHHGAAVCTDYHHCTAYIDLAAEASATQGQDTVEQAVQATKGQILTVNDLPIVAVFSCASGPKTEAAVDVWGSDISYLQSVDSPGGEACTKYKADVTLKTGEFRNKVAEAFPAADVSGAPDTWFADSERTQAGGVKTVLLGGIRVKGTDIRTVFGLNSTNFTITPSADGITFHTVGYGHGVGLSQYGAKYMAEQGSSYQEILTHYYQGAMIQQYAGA